MTSRARAGYRQGCRALSAILLLTVLTTPGPARAQLENQYEEQAVEAVEAREEAPRETVREEAERQQRVEVGWFEDAVDIAEIERMDTAMNRLRGLVDNATAGSEDRANYMFRLAELYYRRARFYEQRAYERRDRAYEVREDNPAQADQYERAADDDLVQSDASALEAIELYVDIYTNYHDSYPGMDGVLYYLGSTLSALGRLEDALDFFEELANDYPSSPYLPRALLAFGEYHFLITGDMEQAQTFYHAVSEFPESEIYPYALYQEAWCFFNLQSFEQGLQRLLDAIHASTGTNAGQIRMRQRALYDLAVFYPQVGTPENAFPFFESVPGITPEEVTTLAELVARGYGDEGNYSASNALWRELMARHSSSFKVVEYQQEIVRNTLPSGNEEEIVREVRRLTELFAAAQGFSDATPEAVDAAAENLEYEVRRLATTYHRDAQVTNNGRLYALAYNLYGDYVDALATQWAEPETQYTMTFYYAELLYKNERYADAAAMWERCIEINPQGEYNEEAVYKAVLAYTRLIDLEEMTVEDAQAPVDEQGNPIEEAAPAPRELPPVMANLVRAADRYLELNPDPQYAAEVDFAAAYVLYEYAHLREAIPRFQRIATTYADVDPQRSQMAAEAMLDALGALQDVGGMETAVDSLRGSDLDQGPFSERLNQLGSQIGFGTCRELQEAGDHEQCGMCYFDFFREFHDSELVDRALYNSAMCFDGADMIAQAIRVREYLIQYRPDSELVPEMRYNLGQSFHRLALYRDASAYYEEYARQHSDAEHAPEALGNAANFREGLGEYDEAIADYETFIDLFEDRRDLRNQVAAAFFQIGAIYEERGQTEEAINQFRRYLDRHADEGAPGLAIQANTRIGRLEWQEDPERAESWFVDALETYNGLDDEQRGTLDGASLDAAAEARFMLGEFVYAQFTAIPIEGDEEEVQEALRNKLEIGRQAGTVYEQVAAFQRPGWSIAAFTRLANLYHEFYEAVINAPVPRGMSEQVEEAYRTMLVERSDEVKAAAILNYQTALDIARTAGWFNEYSEQAEHELAELDPSFRAGNEVRAEPEHEPHSFYQSPYVVSLEEEEDVAPAEPGPVDGEEPTNGTEPEPRVSEAE